MENHAEEKPHRCPKCSASFNVPVVIILFSSFNVSFDTFNINVLYNGMYTLDRNFVVILY